MKIEALSKKSMENPSLIEQYLNKATAPNEEIVFFDWECPPRFINKKNGKEFVDFNVDYKMIFNKKKIDQFTEIPRTVSNKRAERNLIKKLKNIGIKFCLVKFIADLNYELFFGRRQTAKAEQAKLKFKEFKKCLEDELKTRAVETKFFLFSDFLKENGALLEYRNIYKKALRIRPTKLGKIWLAQITRTKNHLGLTNQKVIETISRRTIASYAAEGMILEILNQPFVWLNFAESDKRTIFITNLLRNEKLPMIFPKLNDSQIRSKIDLK